MVTNTLDPVTGVLMADYPNEQEDSDALDIARAVHDRVEAAGFRAVLVKNAIADNGSHRDRVDRAAAEDAMVGVPVQPTPGPMVQRCLRSGWVVSVPATAPTASGPR